MGKEKKKTNIFFVDHNLLASKLNVRKDANLLNPTTKQPLEVDIWLPDFHLYFEFQVFFVLSPKDYLTLKIG